MQSRAAADLELWRRHTPDCPRAKHGRKATKCRCPVWCDGFIDGQRVRQPMKTRDWRRAEWKLSQMLTPEGQPENNRRKPLDEAVANYLADCEARGLEHSTIRSYRKTLEAFVAFCDGKSCFDTAQISVDLVSSFRSSRPGKKEKEHVPNCAASQRRAGRRYCDCPVVTKNPSGKTLRKGAREPEELLCLLQRQRLDTEESGGRREASQG